MTGIECEQEIIDFHPMITSLIGSYKADPISNYYISPSFMARGSEDRSHSHIEKWLATIRQAYRDLGRLRHGKTSYSKFLASILAQRCCDNYESNPNLDKPWRVYDGTGFGNVDHTQLANQYGVRFFSTAAFRILNTYHRFVIILDGFR